MMAALFNGASNEIAGDLAGTQTVQAFCSQKGLDARVHNAPAQVQGLPSADCLPSPRIRDQPVCATASELKRATAV